MNLSKKLKRKFLLAKRWRDSLREDFIDPARRLPEPGARNRRGRASNPPPEETKPALASEMVAATTPELALEIGNFLWHLKTRYFKRPWDSDGASDEDAKVRNALGRLNRCVRAIENAGVKLIDPLGMPYPVGGDGLMRPIQFEPTRDVTRDRVSHTVRPIIFMGDVMIQRSEVYVAVPLLATSAPAEPARAADSGDPADPSSAAHD